MIGGDWWKDTNVSHSKVITRPSPSNSKPARRTWKDLAGEFSVQADFVRVSGDKVVLQGIDKKEISLPLAKLSAVDQQYVKSRLTSVSSANKTITNSVGMKLNLIPAGTFMMGSPLDEKDREDIEHQHKVTISKTFYMQTTEATQGQWQAVMGTEPWKGKANVEEGANYPATYVSWNDAIAYCKTLSAKEGKKYRLPTEAEWEYACRAGTKTAWSFGNDEKVLGDYAWYENNMTNAVKLYAHQVGLKKPNAFGLFDMHGNVYDWCNDYYAKDYYKQSPEKDPLGPASGSLRVLRGGSWIPRHSRDTRSAYRSWVDADFRYYDYGFRVVRELD
jgi:formylglycine-generating enzyme required for sulfatase activity